MVKSKSEQKREEIQGAASEKKSEEKKSDSKKEPTVKLRLKQNFYIRGVFHAKDSVITFPKSVAEKRLKETVGVFAQDVSESKK